MNCFLSSGTQCYLVLYISAQISSSDLCSSRTIAVFDPEMEKHFVFDINQGPDGKMIAVSLKSILA